ncbi:MAG TPA: hypothetical protein VJS41_07390 [Stellaceae bacterium]|nr:hypothetical protein [Stellaceae bacterium]
MAEMSHLIRAAHTASPLIQHTGGVEQLQQVNPQAGPPETYCPPRSAVPHAGPPVGPPIAVHEPAAGEHIVVPVVPNQPLAFDFNPLDLKATEHGQDVTLTFPDGAQVTLHDIIGFYGPQPAPFELPDGTVITPSELLQAFHLSLVGPCGGPALNQINPTAGPIVENTGFGTPPFEIGGIGSGLIPEGPLAPTGFGITNEFVKGVGGGNTTPPGPPGPPTPPPPGTFLTVPDLDTHQYFLGSTHPIPPLGGGTVDQTGNYISEVVASSPAAFIEGYWTPGSPPPAFGTHANPGVALGGQFGTFTMDAAGNYDYQLSAASEHILSQLGTDLMSQAVNQPFHTYQAGFQDVFDVATSNGFESAGTTPADIKQIQFDFYAANVASTAATVGVSAAPASTTSMLLTYTDAADPAHSFQQLVTVDNTGHVAVTPESGTVVQPNDPALVSLEYLSGPGAAVSSVAIEGESFNINATIGPGQHAFAAVINPALDTLGDPGDTGNASAAGASQDSGTILTALTPFNDALSGVNGSFGYLFDGSSTSANGAGQADAVNYAFSGVNSDAATLNGSTTAGATSVIEWSSTATIDANTHIDGAPGSSAANGGLNVLEIESANAQNLDFTSTLSSDPTTGNVKNVEVFDLTDGAHSSTANSITLTANDVFNLAQHEPTAVQNAAGAAALWILGGTSDTVNLAGTGSTWTQISQPVTQVGQGGGNASQMVGFTEYAATTTGGQAVHVYVQNAIQNAGHVAHH